MSVSKQYIHVIAFRNHIHRRPRSSPEMLLRLMQHVEDESARTPRPPRIAKLAISPSSFSFPMSHSVRKYPHEGAKMTTAPLHPCVMSTLATAKVNDNVRCVTVQILCGPRVWVTSPRNTANVSATVICSGKTLRTHSMSLQSVGLDLRLIDTPEFL